MNPFREFQNEDIRLIRKALIRMHNDLGKIGKNFHRDTKAVKHPKFPELQKSLLSEIGDNRKAIRELVDMMKQKLLK